MPKLNRLTFGFIEGGILESFQYFLAWSVLEKLLVLNITWIPAIRRYIRISEIIWVSLNIKLANAAHSETQAATVNPSISKSSTIVPKCSTFPLRLSEMVKRNIPRQNRRKECQSIFLKFCLESSSKYLK